MTEPLKDKFDRRIDYLRISVTDRCNLRCVYCMPESGVELKPAEEILTYEEIIAIAKVAVSAGVKKIRLTGGEPLVRKDVVRLIEGLSDIQELKDLSLTTNGILLAKFAKQLKDAGLKRVNISLDSLDEEVYRKITRGGDLNKVLEGMKAAIEAGLDPVKVNVVINRDIRPELVSMIDLISKYPVHVRFIERMPFNKAEDEESLSCADILAAFMDIAEVESVSGPPGSGPARYFKLRDTLGTIGFICPNTRHICSSCNRLRLTADGKLRTCLFFEKEIDIKSAMRAGASETGILKALEEALASKPKDRHTQDNEDLRRRMHEIGG